MESLHWSCLACVSSHQTDRVCFHFLMEMCFSPLAWILELTVVIYHWLLPSTSTRHSKCSQKAEQEEDMADWRGGTVSVPEMEPRAFYTLSCIPPQPKCLFNLELRIKLPAYTYTGRQFGLKAIGVQSPTEWREVKLIFIKIKTGQVRFYCWQWEWTR